MGLMSGKSAIDWASIREEALKDFTMAALPPTLKMPALPHAVTMFSQKSNDPKVTVKELAKIIETDTGLTMELLRYVNSSFVGLRHKASGVQQALSLLGQRQGKTFVITTGMQAAVRAKQSKLINQACFWNASLQKALFAKEVAKLLKTDDDAAFAGALLQDYLLPVITNELVEPYLQFVQTRDQQPQLITDFEKESFGFDHALAGACLANRWHLPDDMVCCILFHHRGLEILTDPVVGRSPAAAVAISALLPDQIRQNYRGLEELIKLDEKWNAFDFQAIAATVDEKQEEVSLGVKNDFPLSRRCQPVLGDAAAFDDGSLAMA